MWKSVVGHNLHAQDATGAADDWETDPDFENDITEQEQRWGAKTIEGSGRKEHISVADLRQKVVVEHERVKQKENTPKASYGYGGRFGVEKDRMDRAALGHDYVAKVEQHSSQKDASQGFGGKFGVQADRVDESALGFEYKGEVQQHASQKDYSKGFGGKYGVEKDKVDKAALGYDYKGETEKHQSQKDYAKGFGGKFGVEKDKVDKVALGYDYKGDTEKHQSQKDYSKGFGGKFGIEKEKTDKSALGFDYKAETEKHQSQKDYSAGFGGQYGVQTDRMDKSATGYSDIETPTSAYEKTVPLETSSVGAGKLKARFESMAKASEEENKNKVEGERMRRQAREAREREEAQNRPPVTPLDTVEMTREEKSLPAKSPADCAKADYDDHSTHITDIKEEPEEEVLYEEPPALPPREDFLDADAAPLSQRSAEVDDLDEDDGEYEEFSLCNLYSLHTNLHAISEDDGDYEDLTYGLKAKAIYDYQGEADDEISFNPDDIITNVEQVDEGWWKGLCHGRVGLFPAAYVELMQ
ncbi:unnamed protein product [Knipowitschia caucasica]